MIAIAAITDSHSGDYLFTEKVTADEIKYKRLQPWQLAISFKDKMGVLPINIIIIDNDEVIERWYAGREYPDEGDFS
jgi:hypothetical protein